MSKRAKRFAAEVERTATEADAFEADGIDALNDSEAVMVGAEFEPEPYEGASIVEVDELEAMDLEVIETSLADADEAALEAGIASVFDTILAEGFETPLAENDDDATSAGESEDGEAAGDPTFALLAELNRLWAQPLAA